MTAGLHTPAGRRAHSTQGSSNLVDTVKTLQVLRHRLSSIPPGPTCLVAPPPSIGCKNNLPSESALLTVPDWVVGLTSHSVLTLGTLCGLPLLGPAASAPLACCCCCWCCAQALRKSSRLPHPMPTACVTPAVAGSHCRCSCCWLLLLGLSAPTWLLDLDLRSTGSGDNVCSWSQRVVTDNCTSWLVLM